MFEASGNFGLVGEKKNNNNNGKNGNSLATNASSVLEGV
jgi:hypothetical protein